MKQDKQILLSRAGASLLAALMLAGTLLTAASCNGGKTPADTADTSVTGEGSSAADGETGTLPGEHGTAAPSDTDAADTAGENGGTSDAGDSGHLIGDGSEAVGIYPVFSEVGGLYTGHGKTVEITAPEGYTVRYTTDGSIPTKRSTAYKSAIALTDGRGEATVIRAACFDGSGNRTGQVITQTYVCVESTESLTYTVMLTCDEADLNAMYANVQGKIERAAHAEIIAPDGTRIISQDVGLRLFGGSSRALAQKSFKIIARKDGYFGDEPYTGSGTFSYPFFPERTVIAGKNAGKVLDKYDSLILRNGGNDSLLATAEDGAYASLLRDGMANEFAARYATHVGASLAHFAVVYLNGAYYGILELRENQNEDYVKRLWGVSDDDVVVVKSELDTTRACENHQNGAGCRFCGSWFFYETDEDAAAQAEMKNWIALCRKAANAVNADEATYRKVFEEVAAKLDLTNAKEYLAISCYLCNTDWPHNNIRVWRYTGAAVDGLPLSGAEITDGKWRFATRDMDMTMARYATPSPLPELNNAATVDMFEWVLANYVSGYGDTQPYNDALYLQGLFAFLLRDDGFRNDFAAYCRILASEQATAYLLALYEDAYAQVNPIIGDHIDRWSYAVADGFSGRNWRKSASRIESFIKERPEQFLKHLDKLLSLYD